MNKIKKNLLASIIGHIFSILYGFVLPRLILEYYGSEVNGLIQSITQFLGVIGFFDMGIGQVVRSALYEPIERCDNVQLSRIMVSGGRFYRKIAYALLGYVAVLLVVYPISVDKGFDWSFTAGMIAIVSVGLFVQYYCGIIYEQLLYASQKHYILCAIQTICYILNMAICVVMVRMNCSIHAVKLVMALVFLIKPLFCMWYIRHKYTIDWHITYDAEPIKQKWHGVSQHISAVVLDGTDNIVLTLFSTFSNVSIYSVYYMVIGSIQALYQSIVVSIQAAAGAVWAKRDMNGAKQMFSKVEFCLHTGVVFVFCCTAMLIVPFVQVYTNGLADANYTQPTFAAILVLAYGIRCLRTPYNIWILAAGHFKQAQKCHIFAAILNLTISVLAVSFWGLIGVAVGTLVAMCYQTAWMVIYTAKNLVKCSYKRIIKQWLADIVAVLLICTTASGFSLQIPSYLGWLTLAVKVAFISGVCITSVFCIFFAKEVRQLIKRFIAGLRRE